MLYIFCNNCHEVSSYYEDEKPTSCPNCNSTDSVAVIDELIAPIIDIIYSKGYELRCSCASHIPYGKDKSDEFIHPYLLFRGIDITEDISIHDITHDDIVADVCSIAHGVRECLIRSSVQNPFFRLFNYDDLIASKRSSEILNVLNSFDKGESFRCRIGVTMDELRSYCTDGYPCENLAMARELNRKIITNYRWSIELDSVISMGDYGDKFCIAIAPAIYLCIEDDKPEFYAYYKDLCTLWECIGNLLSRYLDNNRRTNYLPDDFFEEAVHIFAKDLSASVEYPSEELDDEEEENE